MAQTVRSNNIFSEDDRKYMKLAIKLAQKAEGRTSPNPMVGAVIVKDGKIISSGFHTKAGNPHAEIEAINACPNVSILKGALIYVTLEPCSIVGRTPPCTDALIKYGFSKVIISSIDPNPEINGNGIELLRKAGIKVKAGLFEDITAKQNEVFFKSVTSKMPFVALKIASSIDGKSALKNKKSKWITSVAARLAVQKIRYKYDCILTGINTIIEDDPLLYPKYAPFLKNDIRVTGKAPGKKFFRVILDSGLRISRDSNIVKTASAIKTVIFTGGDSKISDKEKAEYLKSTGIDILAVSGKDSSSYGSDMSGKGQKRFYLDLKEVLKILYTKYAATSVLVESGPSLMAEFVKHGLADKFYFFIAPKIIGGDSPFDLFSSLGIEAMDDVIEMDFDRIKRAGSDILITAYPKEKPKARI